MVLKFEGMGGGEELVLKELISYRNSGLTSGTCSCSIDPTISSHQYFGLFLENAFPIYFIPYVSNTVELIEKMLILGVGHRKKWMFLHIWD